MTRDEKNFALLETQKVKEKAYQLRVKIISWENGSLESPVISSGNKITPGEWKDYKKHRQSIFPILDKDRIKEDLEKTYNSIKTNGGFK